MLFNCEHTSNLILNPTLVKSQSGSYLHQFKWLKDNEIGELPPEWNWLADEYGENENAKLIHYTLGSPCFEQYRHTAMSSYWLKEHNELQPRTN